MKTYKSILLAGVLNLTVNSLLAAQANTWFEQWHKAKFGRPSPAVEAQLRAEHQNTAFREEPTAALPANYWSEQWYRAKFGHPSPAEEARMRAEQAKTAFREDPAPVPAVNWFNEWHRAKFGRYPGK